MRMQFLSRVLAVGAGLALLPTLAWAGTCGDPLFTVVSGPVLSNIQPQISWVVQVREKVAGCQMWPNLKMTVNGLPGTSMVKITSDDPQGSQVSAQIFFMPSSVPMGTYNVTYTVTDSSSAQISKTVPLVITNLMRANDLPILDPVGDIEVVRGSGGVFSFGIGMSDPNNDLTPLANSLVISGLPSSGASLYWTAIRPDRISASVRLDLSTTSYLQPGTYLVTITGRDSTKASVQAQMRLKVR